MALTGDGETGSVLDFVIVASGLTVCELMKLLSSAFGRKLNWDVMMFSFMIKYHTASKLWSQELSSGMDDRKGLIFFQSFFPNTFEIFYFCESYV